MKRHNLFKVVMITIFVAVLLSWLFPVTYFSSNSGEIVKEARDQIGIFDVMTYIGVAIQYFSHISIYILSIGGLYGILFKLPSYRNLIDKMVKIFDGLEWLFIGIVVALFGISSAIAGISLPLMLFFPFVISVILAMGYDRITAALVTAGSTVVGLMGSVFSVNNTYGFDMVLGTKPQGNWKFKLLMLAVLLVVLFVYILRYAKNHRNTKKQEPLFVPKTADRKGNKTWPIFIILDCLFVIFVLSFMSWSTFGVETFSKLHSKLSSFSIAKFPILDRVFGLSNEFGSWTLVEGSVVIIVAALLLGIAYKVKVNDFVSAFMDGCERALKPALLNVLMYTVLVAVTYVPTLMYICKPIIGSKVGILDTALTTFIYSLFSVESYYVGSGVLPYISSVAGASLTTAKSVGLELVSQGTYGLTMLVAPTSVVVMSTLAYLNIPYHKWIKNVCLIFVILAVVLLIFAKIKF